MFDGNTEQNVFKTRMGSSRSELELQLQLPQDEPSKMMREKSSSYQSSNKLSTFQGVFIPVCLNILGVVIFLRMGWAVSQTGILGALCLLLVGEILVFTTVLSLSALCTDSNISMRAGGAYYLVSRSIGHQLGASMGFLFYFAYTFGASFYVIGLGNSIYSTFFKNGYVSSFFSSDSIVCIIASSALFFILIISLAGAETFSRINIVLFTIQVLALALGICSALFYPSTTPLEAKNLGHQDLHVGLNYDVFVDNLYPQFVHDPKCGASVANDHHSASIHDHLLHEDGGVCSWGILFGIIFPGVTGIMEGANLSGDLADPKTSIPNGTILAVGFTFSMYILLILSLGASFNRSFLLNHVNPLQEACPVGWFILTGIIFSTLSSALGALFGGARVLQAIAQDKLFFTYFSAQTGNEPRRAVLLTWFISQLSVFIGKLDAIASIISSFFLLSYCITNLSCLVMGLCRHDSVYGFNPHFRYWSVYSAGFASLASLITMLYIDVTNSLIAILAFLFLTYYFTEHHLLYPVPFWSESAQVRFYLIYRYCFKTNDKGFSKKQSAVNFKRGLSGLTIVTLAALSLNSSLFMFDTAELDPVASMDSIVLMNHAKADKSDDSIDDLNLLDKATEELLDEDNLLDKEVDDDVLDDDLMKEDQSFEAENETPVSANMFDALPASKVSDTSIVVHQEVANRSPNGLFEESQSSVKNAESFTPDMEAAVPSDAFSASSDAFQVQPSDSMVSRDYSKIVSNSSLFAGSQSDAENVSNDLSDSEAAVVDTSSGDKQMEAESGGNSKWSAVDQNKFAVVDSAANDRSDALVVESGELNLVDKIVDSSASDRSEAFVATDSGELNLVEEVLSSAKDRSDAIEASDSGELNVVHEIVYDRSEAIEAPDSGELNLVDEVLSSTKDRSEATEATDSAELNLVDEVLRSAKDRSEATEATDSGELNVVHEIVDDRSEAIEAPGSGELNLVDEVLSSTKDRSEAIEAPDSGELNLVDEVLSSTKDRSDAIEATDSGELNVVHEIVDDLSETIEAPDSGELNLVDEVLSSTKDRSEATEATDSGELNVVHEIVDDLSETIEAPDSGELNLVDEVLSSTKDRSEAIEAPDSGELNLVDEVLRSAKDRSEATEATDSGELNLVDEVLKSANDRSKAVEAAKYGYGDLNEVEVLSSTNDRSEVIETAKSGELHLVDAPLDEQLTESPKLLRASESDAETNSSTGGS